MQIFREVTNNNLNTMYKHQIEKILSSGLILDEDMECISFNFSGDYDNNNVKLSFLQKLMCGASITSTLFIFTRQLPNSYIPIFLSPILLIGYKYVRQLIYYKNRKYDIESLIKNIREISKINRLLCEYFILRTSSNSVMQPYNNITKDLVDVVFKEEISFLHLLLNSIEYISNHVIPLKSDYSYLDTVDLEQFNINYINNIEDCISSLKKLCDIYVLIVSNCLTCIAVVLCPKIRRKYQFSIAEITDDIIPKIRKKCAECYNNINKKFNDVKYFYLKKDNLKLQSDKPKINSSTKLYNATSNMMVQSSYIQEKSQRILEKLEICELQSTQEKEELSKCIMDLRNQVSDFHDFLDVLHKLYETDLNQSRAAVVHKTSSKIEEPKLEISTKNKTIDAASISEPIEDEEFECYIGDDDLSENVNGYFYEDEDESRMYASILSKELKSKLKSDTRFIAARLKRGIVDEEDIQNEKSSLNSSSQSDNLPPLVFQVEPTDLPNQPSGWKKYGTKPLVPPPPPPPLPPIDVGPYDYKVGDHFESIKAALVGRVHVEEETFGESDDDD